MNYINFKNVDSRSLSGLMICELPPISKPQMRIETTVIEGKDGDITENLGYSAYDKTVKIGLTKGYDLNRIIKYFSGAGNLILSNEPDKFYIAEIFEAISYERLVKFKVTDIKFHVQPFKYLVDEQPTILEISEQEQLEVINQGNEESKPIITLYGEGIITVSVNNHAVFQIDIDDEFVTIDSEKQETYKAAVLKNRFMVGQFPTLENGENIITWTGNLTKIEVQPKSRWL